MIDRKSGTHGQFRKTKTKKRKRRPYPHGRRSQCRLPFSPPEGAAPALCAPTETIETASGFPNSEKKLPGVDRGAQTKKKEATLTEWASLPCRLPLMSFAVDALLRAA